MKKCEKCKDSNGCVFVRRRYEEELECVSFSPKIMTEENRMTKHLERARERILNITARMDGESADEYFNPHSADIYEAICGIINHLTEKEGEK